MFDKIYYHGSDRFLAPGTLLLPRPNYRQRWSNTDFYAALEHYRPPRFPGHQSSVFMCDNEDDVDLAGGATEWLLHVQPIGRVIRCDMNWSSKISCLIGDGATLEDECVESAAVGYWRSAPHPDESVWEYLAPAALVVCAEPY